MTLCVREKRDADLRAAVTGDAEVALERRQHLDLTRERDALDLPMRMDDEAIARFAENGALADETPRDLALADLCARPPSRFGFAGPQNELGGRCGSQGRGVVVPVDRAKLG